jgi:glycerate 2-kinase
MRDTRRMTAPLTTSNLPRDDPRAFLRTLYDAAVAAAQPAQVMADHLPPPPKKGRTVVIGGGKASGAMVEAFDALWPKDAPVSGLVLTRYHHTPPGYAAKPGRIELREASHPVPDEAGLRGAEELLQRVQGLTPDDLVIALVSGGGSALLSLPAPGIAFAEKQAINRALLESGAAIDEMNCVRKHLSAIKGGRLAAACAPATVMTLLISDVPGDAPEVIASGPTLPDATTCADALAICKRYGIELPRAAREGLESGAFETPKPGDARFATHSVRMMATPHMSLEAAARAARAAGVQAHVLSDEIEGESRVVGAVHAALARAVARRGQPFAKPCVILSGGETTVTVKQQGGPNKGRGGRATEFLLGCALALQGEPGVHVLAADTDGIDGIEDNAGAIVTPDTLARAAAMGLSARARLDANDCYNFFAPLGDLVITGPTFTNVNDFRALLVR